ncbi:MAG TPA: lysoplasmalogenase, partial [Chryseolinea sp.]
MKRISSYIFAAVAVGVVLTEIVTIPYLHQIFKPLIMLTLAVFYFYNCENRTTVVWLAMFFSFAGDVLLMFDSLDARFFMAGLTAFLLAHVCYILAYRQYQNAVADHELKGIQKIRFAFPIVLAGTGLLVILYPSLGPMKIPVTVYAIILIIMVINAIFRYGRTSSASFWLVFAGSLLFMVSDSLLAINKFFHPVPVAGFWIMSSYVL